MTTSMKPLDSIRFPGEGAQYRAARDELRNLFDLTPEGGGSGWYPRVSYR